MKKRIYSQPLLWCKCFVIVFLSVLFATNTKAQIINEGFEEPEWAGLNGTSGQIVITNTSASSTMSYLTAGSSFTTATNTNPNSGTWWYSKAGTNSANKLSKVHSITFAPKLSSSGYIITPLTSSAIVSVTFWAQIGTPLVVGLATDPNVTQPSYSSPNPIPLPFANFSTSFPANAAMTSYSIAFTGVTGPVRIGFFNQGGSSSYLDDIIITQPTGTSPSVTTDNVVPGVTNAAVTGTVKPGTLPLLASGIIWSTSPLTGTAADTTLPTKTRDIPSAKTAFTDTIKPLLPSVKYYTEAYVVGLDNSVSFGGILNILNFTTKPKGVPTLDLTIPNVYSNKVSAVASNIDSSGSPITERGFIYNSTGNANINSNSGKFYEGTGIVSFSDFVKGLKPNTHYCVKAYAINASGPGYSKDVCFTTGAPEPVLTAVPGTIDFGQNYYQSSPLILSYTLTGAYLTGAAITIKAPAGFIIATSPSSFGTTTGNTLTLTTATTPGYSGATLSATPIYVEMPTSAYGTFSGNIVQSGGGVTTAANADMVILTGSVVQSPIDVSNTGTDYWLGYGFEQKMQSKTSATDSANLIIYVSGTPGTLVTCETPLLGVPARTLPIPAGGILTIDNLPKGDGSPQNAGGSPDTRLYYTAITNRGIHVYSNGAPISVWLYDYATNNSAGGSLVFPTNTWNSNYVVQAYGNTANSGPSSGPPNSFFFVLASQDNTPVYFTPSVDILDSATSSLMTDVGNDVAGNVKYFAGVTYTINLNRGQVFNAIGAENNSYFGLDLSGSTVRTDCDKKIAVFCGNGRCLVKTPSQCTSATSGSDNMIQQMIPSVAWDTKYFTVPTKSMEHNLYRIYVHSDTTSIWVNDSTHLKAGSKLSNTGALINGTTFNGDYQYYSFGTGLGGYYALETSYPMMVESASPMSITEFIISNGCSSAPSITGLNGSGDPEMIILTGANQAINKATVYSPTIKDGSSGGAYINVIIPTSGVSTFSLIKNGVNLTTVDTGSNSFTGGAYGTSGAVQIAKAFTPFPANPTFSYAKFLVGNGTVGVTSTISASVPFNAIAYGVASGESYGFNAGTQVKNLSSIQFTDNPNGQDSSATAVRTCLGNSVTLKLALPYLPSTVDSIIWNPQGDPRITPNNAMKGAMNGAVAKYDNTIIVNGRTFYVYSSPVKYSFNQVGTYRFPVTAYGKFASDCPGEDIENMLVIVGHDQDNLSFTPQCGNPNVLITSDTIPAAGTNIVKWTWDFGDGSLPVNGGSLDSTHKFPGSAALYTVKLTTYNSVGCISTDSVQVDFSGGLKADFTPSAKAVCAGGAITYQDNSVVTGNSSGHIIKWTWYFGDGSKPDSSGPTVPHTYLNPGKFKDTLRVNTDAGCVDFYIDSVTIEATPVAAFTVASACFGSANIFTDKSFVPNNLGTVDSSFWDFGDGTKLDSLTGSTISHVYATTGTHTVTLTVKSDGGCSSTLVTQVDTVFALPIAGFKDSVDCANLVVVYTDTSHANGGTIIKWDWDLGDAVTDTVTTKAGISFSHPYPAGNGQSFGPSLLITTLAGCTASYTPPKFTIGVAPTASISLAAGALCLPSAPATFSNNSTISDNSLMTYTWHFADGSATADSSILIAAAPAPATHNFTGNGPYNVTITAKSNLGCTATSLPVTVTVHSQPVAKITSLGVDCLNDSLAFSANGTTGAVTVNNWKWDFGDKIPYAKNLQNPKYEWQKPGPYTVSLVETSTDGCISDSAHQSIVVDTLPVALFTLGTVDCTTETVQLIDNSDAKGGTITEWDWDYGDGTTEARNSGAAFTHTYSKRNGIPTTVSLTVKTKDGCTSIVPSTQSFTIGASPDPAFTLAAGTLCLPNAAATFINNSTISDGTTNAMSYVWNFGDNTPDSVVLAGPPALGTTHVYTGTGPYTVKLTAVSNNSCTSSITYNLTTINAQPSAVITSPIKSCLNDSITLSGNTSSGNLVIGAWDWNFGDNSGKPTPNASTVKYAWSTATKYGVSLVVTSVAGCKSDSTHDSVTVNPLPVAHFSISQPSCEKYAIVFTNASSANVNQWSWNFGDGSKSSVQNPSHSYTSSQSFPIILHVTDVNGCSSNPDDDSSIVVNPLPQPAVTVSPICLSGSSIDKTLTASSSGSALVNTWNWTFDDSPPKSGSQVVHTYNSTGPHSLQLIAISDAGCADTLNFADTVYSVPVAKDSILNDTALCSNKAVTILNESYIPGLAGYGSISKVEIYWNYTSASQAPDITDNSPVLNGVYTKQYPALASDNNYTIRINAYSGNGCPSQSADSPIVVHGSPLAQFTPLTAVCANAADFTLMNGSEVAGPSGIGTYSGRGVNSQDSVFSPSSVGAGTYTITYTFNTKPYGCFDTAQATIQVYPIPSADYGAEQTVLSGDSITLNQQSVVGGPGLTYLWSPFIYLSSDTSATPLCKPADSVTYTIIVTSPGGCSSKAYLHVQPLLDFVVPNTFTPNHDGINDTWDLPELVKYPIQRVEIFDRYGQVLYESEGYKTPGWDGTRNGHDLPAGTYYYIIELNGMRTPKTGYVTILR